MQNKTMVT